jgi:hypothetical protein
MAFLICNVMSRPATASLIGILGFLAYVALVMVASDWVIGTHWVAELLFFAAAGVVWVWPARRLMFWGAGR